MPYWSARPRAPPRDKACVSAACLIVSVPAGWPVGSLTSLAGRVRHVDFRCRSLPASNSFGSASGGKKGLRIGRRRRSGQTQRKIEERLRRRFSGSEAQARNADQEKKYAPHASIDPRLNSPHRA